MLSPSSIRSRRIRYIEVCLFAVGVMFFVAITAAHGATAINIPLPNIGQLLETVVIGGCGEMLRRTLSKLDGIRSEFIEFKAEIKTALFGVDMRGGAIEKLSDVDERVQSLERKVGV